MITLQKDFAQKRKLAYWMFFAMAALIVAFAPFPTVAPSLPAVRVFRVEASQFGYDPSVLFVNSGDTVIIQLVSMDVVHGLYIDGYGVSVTADPGQTQSLTFLADKPGSFRFRCIATCGAMHPFMIGKLNVGLNTALIRATGLAMLGVLGAVIFMQRKPDL
jgi:heme/copper-type cytochrome/quinol oxidase subunit 2